MRSLVATAVLLMATTVLPAPAQPATSFCAAAAGPVAASPVLSAAVRAAFGDVAFVSEAEACTYPLKALDYTDAEVLFTTAGVPGGSCHGCPAHLSVAVLRRTAKGLRLSSTLRDVAAVGTFGSPGPILKLDLGGDDGFAIENGGLFQGYSFTELDLYLFQGGQVVHIEPERRLILSADNAGAALGALRTIRVVGSWAVDRADPAVLDVTYRIAAQGRSRLSSARWRLAGRRLRLVDGAVPPEAIAASGE